MEIGYVKCPAFDGEKIYFTNRGFKHLLFKDREYRSIPEQMRRINLLKRAPVILSSSQKHNAYREIKDRIQINGQGKNSIVCFWSFSQNFNGEKTIVIVRQINDESKHFFSIMNKK